MSIFDGMSRWAERRVHARSVRTLNALSPELRKDIGWPVMPGAQEETRLKFWTLLR